MMEGRKYCTLDMVSLLVVGRTERRLSFVQMCGLTQMIMLHTAMVFKVLFGQKCV